VFLSALAVAAICLLRWRVVASRRCFVGIVEWEVGSAGLKTEAKGDDVMIDVRPLRVFIYFYIFLFYFQFCIVFFKVLTSAFLSRQIPCVPV